ncbi:MAG: hypothetical protein IJ658_00685 [Kiritimatiellae bacterium]|nr:hypothetical protein [Kiritimatiellia bacterium]
MKLRKTSTSRKRGVGAFGRLSFALIALGAWSAWAAANFPVGTHIIKGSVMGYDENGRNILLSSENGVTIRAVDTNGQVIAESKVTDATQDGVNFALQIPLSKTATDSTCAVGDQLNCVMVEASGILISAEPLTVGGARESQTVTLKMVDVKRYVSEDGSKTNQVAQAYVDAIQAWMEDDEELDEQFRGKPYDPFADYDNDGSSNYAEYLAGTNPFDASDRLKITAFSISRTSGTAALSFEYVGGHVYGVNTTTNLTNPTWLSQKIRTSETGEELALIAPSTDLEDIGTNTIYMTPAMDAPQGFFWLEAK